MLFVDAIVPHTVRSTWFGACYDVRIPVPLGVAINHMSKFRYFQAVALVREWFGWTGKDRTLVLSICITDAIICEFAAHGERGMCREGRDFIISVYYTKNVFGSPQHCDAERYRKSMIA